ncbi:unnamed protein product [Dibothriocephalus latus]|uniref:Uncharacterized protein n=1 Tax=Dibothriocephalus latus TaxID=60516 RepID=A0A3P6TTY6_DIBLA|nr:unnamed protein product [Dibothriocephalus latus]
MGFCFLKNCASFTDMASIYKAFYRIFATSPEHDDCYSALLLPLLQRIYSRFQSIVLQRLAFDDSRSSERATELLSQFQGIEPLVTNLPLPHIPAIWSKVFPEGRLPCGCSFALTKALLEPAEHDHKPCEPTESDNPNGGSFAETFKHTLIDCIVDLRSVPVQALPEGLLFFFNNLEIFVQAEDSPLGCFRFLIIAYMIDSEVQPGKCLGVKMNKHLVSSTKSTDRLVSVHVAPSGLAGETGAKDYYLIWMTPVFSCVDTSFSVTDEVISCFRAL